jgi:predicted Zn-dependent protease
MNEEQLKKEAKRVMNEHELAWNEFFKDKPQPKNDEEEQKEAIDFAFWYNNVRLQSDTGKTPAEMGERFLEYGENSEEEMEDYEKQLALKDIMDWIHDGRFKQALKECEWLLGAEPKNVELLLFKFEALVGLRKMKKAQETLELCRKLDAEEPMIAFHSAEIFLLKKDFKNALKEIDTAIAKDEKNFDFLVMKANILFLLGNPGYNELLKKAESVDKKRLLNFIDNYWLDTYPQCGTEANKILEKANEFLFTKQKDKAQEEFKKLDNLPLEKPLRELVKVTKIEDYLNSRNMLQAEKLTEELLAENPQNPYAYYYQAKIALSKGKPEKALETINKGIETTEKTKTKNFNCYYEKAEILKTIGAPEYKKWEAKGNKIKKLSLKQAMKDAEKMGKKCIIKDDLVKFE